MQFVQAMYNNNKSKVSNTVMNLELKLEFIRVQYLAQSYTSFYSKLCHVSSALGHPGSCCMMMT